MRIDVLTLFPGILEAPLGETLLGRARRSGALEVVIHDLRGWGLGRHRSVDDYPFGGGPGMVMRPEPLFAAVEAIQPLAEPSAEVVLLTPQGRRLDAPLAAELARSRRLLLICGRYEGVDERVRDHLVDREVSVADVVVSGGEIPALLVIDAVARRVPGVLGAEDSLAEESFDDGLLEYPQYTRPRDFRGWGVPPVLLSGDHGAVARWRRGERVRRTRQRRPDLLAGAALSEHERAALAEPGAGPGDAGTGPAGGLDPSAPDP
ncbi:MAG: tRNA (guanosine(37)-N1)-methyltransferase TrmD [Chloroflexi bacterium]|nr:tRNA (guanosine(37)-N1)-methyltransferase TrmD [Chloroflexota bacterium]